jgi:hypothetical protein
LLERFGPYPKRLGGEATSSRIALKEQREAYRRPVLKRVIWQAREAVEQDLSLLVK